MYFAVTVAYVAILAVLVAPGMFPVKEHKIELFERDYGLRTSPEVRRFLRYYLTTGNRLRRLAFVAVMVVPPLASAALWGSNRGMDPISTPVVVALMVGTLLAELTLGRSAGRSPTRVASLRRRDLAAYLSLTLRFTPGVVGVAAIAAWMGTLGFPEPTQPLMWPNPTRSEVATAVAVAVAVPALVALACRWIVRRPQPLVDPDLVAADDAVRAASVRRIAAMGCVVALFNLAGALYRYRHTMDGYADIVLGAGIFVILCLASAAWSSRSWGPLVPRGHRRRDASTTSTRATA